MFHVKHIKSKQLIAQSHSWLYNESDLQNLSDGVAQEERFISLQRNSLFSYVVKSGVNEKNNLHR